MKAGAPAGKLSAAFPAPVVAPFPMPLVHLLPAYPKAPDRVAVK